jgi:hypothetical protein
MHLDLRAGTEYIAYRIPDENARKIVDIFKQAFYNGYKRWGRDGDALCCGEVDFVGEEWNESVSGLSAWLYLLRCPEPVLSDEPFV